MIKSDTYSKIALGTGILQAARQGSANLLGQRMFATGARDFALGHSAGQDILRRLPQGVSFELDRHDCDGGKRRVFVWDDILAATHETAREGF